MRILIPVDGSEPALDAVRHALKLRAAGLKAEIVLATVQDPTYVYEMVLAPDAEVLDKVSGAAGGRALEGAEALLKAASVPYEREILSGFAATSLLEAAERRGCDMIVMGARGLGQVRGALLGSVSQKLVHDAPMPVTIVKHADGED